MVGSDFLPIPPRLFRDPFFHLEEVGPVLIRALRGQNRGNMMSQTTLEQAPGGVLDLHGVVPIPTGTVHRLSAERIGRDVALLDAKLGKGSFRGR